MLLLRDSFYVQLVCVLPQTLTNGPPGSNGPMDPIGSMALVGSIWQGHRATHGTGTAAGSALAAIDPLPPPYPNRRRS